MRLICQLQFAKPIILDSLLKSPQQRFFRVIKLFKKVHVGCANHTQLLYNFAELIKKVRRIHTILVRYPKKNNRNLPYFF